jgi:hypothetical protein
MARRTEQALKRMVDLADEEVPPMKRAQVRLMREAQAQLGHCVALVHPLTSGTRDAPLPAGTLGRVIEVALPVWLFAEQNGSPQPEHRMECADAILTVRWDVPGGADQVEASFHWHEYRERVRGT